MKLIKLINNIAFLVGMVTWILTVSIVIITIIDPTNIIIVFTGSAIFCLNIAVFVLLNRLKIKIIEYSKLVDKAIDKSIDWT